MKKQLSFQISKGTQKFALLIATMLVSGLASAATAPTDLNSLGGQMYDLFFNQGYDSGVAYVLSGALGVFGFMQIKQDWKQAMGYGVGAGGLAGLPAILTALGASI